MSLILGSRSCESDFSSPP